MITQQGKKEQLETAILKVGPKVSIFKTTYCNWRGACLTSPWSLYSVEYRHSLNGSSENKGISVNS
jgi:hypothetical protein